MVAAPVAVQHVNSCLISISIYLWSSQGNHSVPNIVTIIAMKNVSGDNILNVFGKILVISSAGPINAAIIWEIMVTRYFMKDNIDKLFAFARMISGIICI